MSSQPKKKQKTAATEVKKLADYASIRTRLYKELDLAAEEFGQYLKAEFAFQEEHIDRVKKMILYTCSGGKLNRGILAVTTAQELAKSKGATLTTLQEKRALILALCNEMLQACFLVADDIMDGSSMRRGKPCWYKVPEVQLDAVNDSLILESVIYFLLKAHFGETPVYHALCELFRKVSLQTQMGQMLDLVSQPQGTKNPQILAKFTLKTYRQIILYKTAFYSFYLPVASGMLLMGFSEKKQLDKAETICKELGEKFQIQDDWLDAFGDPKKIGKDGTDIKDHKCTWLVVMALLRMSAAQRTTLERCYGKEDAESAQTVKALYLELGLKELYLEQETASRERVLALLDAALIPPSVFTVILDKIHLREK